MLKVSLSQCVSHSISGASRLATFQAYRPMLVRLIRVCYDSWVRNFWGISSFGRAPALQAGGGRFEPDMLHHQ
jgi:hypothetical protein